jgi:hypothetical protein
VIRDLAVMLADGGECVSDLGAVRDQLPLFGEVASDSTAFRVIDRVASERLLGDLRAAHGRARERFWRLPGAPERLSIDIDATLITAHSTAGVRRSCMASKLIIKQCSSRPRHPCRSAPDHPVGESPLGGESVRGVRGFPTRGWRPSDPGDITAERHGPGLRAAWAGHRPGLRIASASLDNAVGVRFDGLVLEERARRRRVALGSPRSREPIGVDRAAGRRSARGR